MRLENLLGYDSAISLWQILRLQYADGGQKSEADETMDVLSDLYRRLGEHDVMCGLWCRQSAAMETKVGVSYIQFGYWQKAQDIFLNAMTKCQGGGISNATKAEKIVWEEQWIACAKQLNQWEVLKEYATDVNQFDLLLESCWKTDSWMEIKEALADPMPSDASQTKVRFLVHIYPRIYPCYV
jgi:phosphatidylinositol kinase/protein kinase (PI-3  family)